MDRGHKQQPREKIAAKRKKRGRPPATRQEIAASRAIVIRAAAEVYGQRGYDDTNVAHFLEAAGISRPTFYKLFANKHEVLAIVVRNANEALLEHMVRQLQVAETPLEKLTAVIDAYLNWGQETGPLVRYLYSEIYHPRSPVGPTRQWLLEQLLALFAAETRAVGLTDLDPLFLEILISAVERAGASLFEREAITPDAVVRTRHIMMRIAVAALARPDEYDLIPPLPRCKRSIKRNATENDFCGF